MVVIKEISERFKIELYRNTGFAFCSPFCLMIGNSIMNGNPKTLIHLGTPIAMVFFAIGFMMIVHAMQVAMQLDMVKSRYDNRKF